MTCATGAFAFQKTSRGIFILNTNRTMLPDTTVRAHVAGFTPIPELENHSVGRISGIDTLTLSTMVTKGPGTPNPNLKCLVSTSNTSRPLPATPLGGICSVFRHLINRYKIYHASQLASAQDAISNSTPANLFSAVFKLLDWTIQLTASLPVFQTYLCISICCWLYAPNLLVSTFQSGTIAVARHETYPGISAFFGALLYWEFRAAVVTSKYTCSLFPP
jgi:hypothetical protein